MNPQLSEPTITSKSSIWTHASCKTWANIITFPCFSLILITPATTVIYNPKTVLSLTDVWSSIWIYKNQPTNQSTKHFKSVLAKPTKLLVMKWERPGIGSSSNKLLWSWKTTRLLHLKAWLQQDTNPCMMHFLQGKQDIQ